MLKLQRETDHPLPLIVIALGAVLETTLFGTIIIGFLLTIVTLAIVLSKGRFFFRMLPRAFLILCFYYLLMFLIGFKFEFFQNEFAGKLIVYAPLIALLYFASSMWALPNPPTHRSSAFLTGPAILLAVLSFAYFKSGRVANWAMSGDARNNIYQTRAIIDRGGLMPFNSYPGLANGISAVVGGWQFNTNAVTGGHLGAEINIYALTSIFFLIACSFFASILITERFLPSQRQSVFGILLLSLFPLSQIWLHTYLYEGFFSSSFALAIALAVFADATQKNSALHWKLISSGIGFSLIWFTFPLIAPLTLPVAALAVAQYFLWKKRTINKRLDSAEKAIFFTIIVATAFATNLVLKNRSLAEYAERNLNNYGRIAHFDNRGLLILTILAGIIFLCSSASLRFISALTFTVGITAILGDNALNRILTEDYYLSKYRWISTAILLILDIAIVTIFVTESRSVVVKLAGNLVLIGVTNLCIFPILQKFPTQPTIVKIVDKWQLPTASEAHLIIKTNKIEPRSIFWRISPDYLATQVIDIWITLGFDAGLGAFTWGYSADVFSLEAVCELASKNTPATIWVVSDEVKMGVESVCNLDGVTVRAIQ